MTRLSYSLLLSFPDPKLSLAFTNAFLPEQGSSHEKHARTTVKVKNNSLQVNVVSTEKVALRASVLSAVELLDLGIRLAEKQIQ